ncbi:DUF6653 family protein [Amycolatopsis taiwanensis]|uniref:Uncharacterized protein n=1 Tax=Amycolatopsis taiwanensis TaxID=342230 RepID=A0A9W6VEW1_9PSEU|nr:DUF6653 family protein [Amycolatopsis taiwanensis]GLY64867.1 hypothetical protein Atai01_14860 [Amycolatopsis taiwanensis]
MKTTEAVAATFGMTDEAWKRHANAWSVWSRMAGLAPILAPIFFRQTLGWWALAIIVPGIAWMWLNPRAFKPVYHPTKWAEKGIYGEKLWSAGKSAALAGHRTAMRLLIGLAGAGALIMIYGLVFIEAWPAIFGITLVLLSQLWQIDRFVSIYDESVRGEQ